jgi:hypothetical protein
MTVKTYTHLDDCQANVYKDDDECTCGGWPHRAFGKLGSFTVHAPADYQPRHSASGS